MVIDDTTSEHESLTTQIRELSQTVGHLEATAATHGGWTRNIEERVERIDEKFSKKLDQILDRLEMRTRQPMLPFISIMLVGAGVLLAIGGQALAYLSQHQEQMREVLTSALSEVRTIDKQIYAEFHKHSGDGHPSKIKQLIDKVSEQSVARHVAQSEDIHRLNESHLVFEHRLDGIKDQLTETKIRQEEWKELMQFKSADRWTKTQDDERTMHIQRRIEDGRAMLEALTVREEDKGAVHEKR